jgi:F-type H+-transporting ATPase subunit b
VSRLGRIARTAGLGVGTLLLVVGPALAEEAAAGEHGAHQVKRFLGLPYEVYWGINLVLFIFLLIKFGGPAVVSFLEDKQREIQHALAESQKQKLEVASMESRLAGQIAELRKEVDELSARAERESERERQEILAEAARERERLGQAAKNEIQQSLQQARQELSVHAAQLASSLAGEKLASGLSREDKKRLFRDNLARLEKKGQVS